MPDGNGQPTLGEVYRLQEATRGDIREVRGEVGKLQTDLAGLSPEVRHHAAEIEDVKAAQRTLRNMMFGAFVTLIVQLIGGFVIWLATGG